LIALGGADGTPDALILNISGTNFTEVESRGDFAAVLGTLETKVFLFLVLLFVLICFFFVVMFVCTGVEGLLNE
jgi:ABC-type Na+ efflux pump permease subunit